MSKIAFITDTHFGVRNDSIAFLDYFKKFYNNVFFPCLEENEIDTIIHLGDLVDRRKYISFHTAHRLWKDFMSKAHKYDFHLILGNHDVAFKNTNRLNAAIELYRHLGIKIYDKAEEVTLKGETFLFIPWINIENKEHTHALLAKTKASTVLGHLELRGFEMHKGILSNHGDDPSIFSRFNMVCSGHYHRRSTHSIIHYLGSPCEFTWADYDDPKGFHIYDTETKELTFIPNPYIMFHKVFYDDADKRLAEVMEIDFEQYKGAVVKVVVQNKTNPFWFDKFLTEIEKQDPANLQIVEDHGNLNEIVDEDIVSEAESTLDIFKKHITQGGFDESLKPALEKCIVNLYSEAMTLEN